MVPTFTIRIPVPLSEHGVVFRHCFRFEPSLVLMFSRFIIGVILSALFPFRAESCSGGLMSSRDLFSLDRHGAVAVSNLSRIRF